jgi:hypothetical protein
VAEDFADEIVESAKVAEIDAATDVAAVEAVSW